MIASFAVSAGSLTQPPIDPTVYTVATIGQPSRMDPARAYDTASGELIQNVAQTLIWWNDKNVITFTPGVGHNLTLSEYANLDNYTPVLAAALPTIVANVSGEYYTFTIRTTATFQPWTAANGSVIPSRALTAADVIYSFQRQMVYDSYYAPTWMWFEPAFGTMGLSNVGGGSFPCYGNGTFKNPADEAAAGALIQSWCYPGPSANDVSFHFLNPWAPGVLNQIFAQTWGSIVEPEWVMERGGWSGQFPIGASTSDMSAGWTNLWHWKPTVTRSEIDAWKDPAIYGPAGGSKYAGSNHHVNEIMGTGPYMFTSWDQTNKIWRIDAWQISASIDGSQYWIPTNWAVNHLTTVIEKGLDSWPTRKMLFLEGEFDVIAVPQTNMHELLATDAYTPIPGVNLVYNIPALRNDMEIFTMNVSGASPYQSYVGYPTHKTAQEPLFFANEHIRRAFAWALNYTQYIQQAYFGEGIPQRSWWIEGLSPATYKNTNASMPQRNLNYTEMQNELNQAIVDGFNVSQEGFETTIHYWNGSDQRKIAANMIADAFHSLDPKYRCNVVGQDYWLPVDWEQYYPLTAYGWLADFADPNNLCEAYQASWGNFIITLGPPFPPDQAFVDQEIRAALVEPDSAKRGAMYQDLQYRYWLDVPSFPLVQPVTRRWARYWVQGWYFNALFPGLYAYDLYKTTTPLENVDLDMTATVTPASPTYNPVYIFHNQMRKGNGDISPANMTYNLHVARNDNNNAIAILYAAVGLTYTTGSNKQFANGSYVALAPGGSATASMIWWADGTNVVLAGNSTGIAYAVAGETQPINNNAQDTNATNNVQAAGTLIAKTLPGDVTGNGLVDIYDAIQLANAFGSYSSGLRYNSDADTNGDGQIDIYDAIVLADNFNAHVP
jgi:peptide/nickel transport system substrate-binding protein